MWLGLGVKLGMYLAKRKADEPTNTITIEDTIWGFTIICSIHPDVEESHRCEVWIYDSKERITRVRMVGSSLVHTLNGATDEAKRRLTVYKLTQK